MASTLVMCIILSACQNTAAANQNDFSNIKSKSIQINHSGEKRVYHVDGKRFTFKQLSTEQQQSIRKIEKQLKSLENIIEIDGEKIEKWGAKMEIVAERMEEEALKFEQNLKHLEFDQNKIESLSVELSKISSALEENMSVLSDKMKELEQKMPQIDQDKISQIEVQAQKLKTLLLEIAETI